MAKVKNYLPSTKTLLLILLGATFVILFVVSINLREAVKQKNYLDKISLTKAPSDPSNLFVGYNSGPEYDDLLVNVSDPFKIERRRGQFARSAESLNDNSIDEDNNNNKNQESKSIDDLIKEAKKKSASNAPFHHLANKKWMKHKNNKQQEQRQNGMKKNNAISKKYHPHHNHHGSDENDDNDGEIKTVAPIACNFTFSDFENRAYIDVAILFEFVDQMNKEQNTTLGMSLQQKCLNPSGINDTNTCNYLLKSFFRADLSFLNCSTETTIFTNNFDQFFGTFGQDYYDHLTQLNGSCKKCSYFLLNLINIWTQSTSIGNITYINFLTDFLSLVNNDKTACGNDNFTKITNLDDFYVIDTSGNHSPITPGEDNFFCFSLLWQLMNRYSPFLLNPFDCSIGNSPSDIVTTLIDNLKTNYCPGR